MKFHHRCVLPIESGTFLCESDPISGDFTLIAFTTHAIEYIEIQIELK